MELNVISSASRPFYIRALVELTRSLSHPFSLKEKKIIIKQIQIFKTPPLPLDSIEGRNYCATVLCAPLSFQFVIHAFLGVTLNSFGQCEFTSLSGSGSRA
jgi:hypothetical protein